MRRRMHGRVVVMWRGLGPLQGSALLQVAYQAEGSVAVQVVPVQPFAPQKPQPLVQLQTGCVGGLGLEDNLIGIAGGHGVDGHAHEMRGDAASAVGLLDGEHGDVAAEGAGAVGFKLGDDDAKEGLGCRVKGLLCISRGGTKERNQAAPWASHQVAQVPPLVQEVTVDIDAVGLGQVFGDELADGGQEALFLGGVVRDVEEARQRVLWAECGRHGGVIPCAVRMNANGKKGLDKRRRLARRLLLARRPEAPPPPSAY